MINFISDIFGYITVEYFLLPILCVEDMKAVHDPQQIQEDQRVNQNLQNPFLGVAPSAAPVIPQDQQPQMPQEVPLNAENLAISHDIFTKIICILQMLKLFSF